jgi:hypothetical protein
MIARRRVMSNEEYPVKDEKLMQVSGLWVPDHLLARANAVAKAANIDLPDFCLALWEDFLRILEAGEMPAMPPRILTAKEALLLKIQP